MPLPPGTRYRYKKYPSGKVVRLAFKNNKVIEAVPYKKGSGGKLIKRVKERKG